MDSLLTACLEAVLGQREASQLQLHSPEEEKVRLENDWQIGRVADSLDAFVAILTPGLKRLCGLGSSQQKPVLGLVRLFGPKKGLSQSLLDVMC